KKVFACHGITSRITNHIDRRTSTYEIGANSNPSSDQGVAMRSEQPIWCVECFLRIAPYELHTVYQNQDYHQNCFLKRVRKEADEEISKRSHATFVRQGATGVTGSPPRA